MQELYKNNLVEKFINISFVKSFLALPFVENINKSLQPNIKNIFSVLGIIAIIIGALSLLGALSTVFLFMFLPPLLIISIILIVSSGLTLFLGIGLFSLKNYVPFFVIVLLSVSVILYLFQLVMATAGVTSVIIGLLLNIIITTLVLKNKEMFKGIKKDSESSISL